TKLEHQTQRYRVISLNSQSARNPADRSMVAASRARRPSRSLQRPNKAGFPPAGAAPVAAIAIAVLVTAFSTTVAEAGAIGGRDVPWWYPSRDWFLGSDDDAVGRGWAAGVDIAGQLNREEPESLIAKALLAREFVDNCVSRDLAEDETWTEAMPQCSVHEASNHTLRRLGASINRCASPNYTIMEIHPSQLVYSEEDSDEEAAKEQEKQQRQQEEDEEGKTQQKHSSEGSKEEKVAGVDDSEEQPQTEYVFVGILLFLKGDYFSSELANALTAVAPAYPQALVVKADAPRFLSFCVQYHLHTFPQLLLFKDERLVSKYRGRRSPEDLAAWLSLYTGDLPQAIPRRALPPPTPPHPLSAPGADEPLTWAALLYAAAKIVSATVWFVKKRRRITPGAGTDAGGGPGGLAGRMGRFRRWLAGAFLIRRGRG
ncbi:unnamed protein product, partial [Ascophyllum nodosum]